MFQRLAEATLIAPGGTSYLGVDLLHDLNEGLFAELASSPLRIGFYRRELQRNYEQLLSSVERARAQPQPVVAGLWAREPWSRSVRCRRACTRR